MFNWLFYVGPIVFYETIGQLLYDELMNLVFGVKLLMESSSSRNISLADHLLNEFCKDVIATFRENQRIETINVHSLRHLPDQVKRFGPLFCCSALSFESANRILGELFTSSHHEIEIICRRFLQLRRLNDTTIESPEVQRVWNQLFGIEELEKSQLDHGTKETDLLREGRRCYSNGRFYNRQFFRNVYFDSQCFSRVSMQGDCKSFVSFSYRSELCFGQIMSFVSIPEFYNSKIRAVVKKYQTLEEVGTVKGFFFLSARDL